MNIIERHMLDILERGRDQYGMVAIKAEFEAEGTRPDEFLRIIELARRAGLKVALKIGGCEAVSDLLASKLYGVDFVIAPMVESPYALSKFIDAKNKTHTSDEQSEVDFLFNLETDLTLSRLDELVAMAKGSVDGLVFGRVDFTLSRQMPRTAINDQSITDAVLQAARACAASDLELVVGGSVSSDAIDALREVRAVRLDRFETRKVIFDGSALDSDRIYDGIAAAIDFELNWLRNKRDYYHAAASEDLGRIEMMEKRLAPQRLETAAAE